MPRFKGVYRDVNGWYFKARTSKDPLTGKWTQVTRRGFATATEASIARQALLDQGSVPEQRPPEQSAQ
jgi:Arm DNA-binding domain